MRAVLVTAAALAAMVMAPGVAISQTGSITIERDGGSITLYDVPDRAPAAVRTASAVRTTELEVWVEGTATSTTGALSAADLAAQRVIRAMAAAGATGRIDPAGVDVISEREPVRLAPRRSRVEERRRVVGYRASRLVVVTAPAGRDAGLLMDLATGAGATDIFVGSVGERPASRMAPAAAPGTAPARTPALRAERGQRSSSRFQGS